MLPEEVGGYPADESVYGVRDLAGKLRDWTARLYQADGEAGAVVGDAWTHSTCPTPCSLLGCPVDMLQGCGPSLPADAVHSLEVSTPIDRGAYV